MTVLKIITVFLCAFLYVAAPAFGQGHPVVKNFNENDYKANNRNFDIAVDTLGIVWTANFEGLLYYDNAQWRILRAPGLARITSVFCDGNGTIWVGGYNFVGRVGITENGMPELIRTAGKKLYEGEVEAFWQDSTGVKFVTGKGNLCRIENDSAVLVKKIHGATAGLSETIDLDSVILRDKILVKTGVIQTVDLGIGYKAVNIQSEGISITKNDSAVYFVNAECGLTSNNTVKIVSGKDGVLWGAGDKGVFAVQTPSPYAFFYRSDGLSGTVMTIEKYDGKIYAGTLDGSFVLENGRFRQLKNIPGSCWDIEIVGSKAYFGTSKGIFSSDGEKIMSGSVLSLRKINDNAFYAGCIDGVYYIKPDENYCGKICPLEKVIKIVGKNDDYWAESLYGQIWRKPPGEDMFFPHIGADSIDTQAAAVLLDGRLALINPADTFPIAYPLYSHYDADGIAWLTGNDGKNIYCYRDGQKNVLYKRLLHPLGEYTVRGFEKCDGKLWLGIGDEIAVLDLEGSYPIIDAKARVKIRSVVINGDSTVWGGFGQMPKNLGEFEPDVRNFKFVYSLDNAGFSGRRFYRYRLNGSPWSIWEDDNDVEYLNLHYGKYTFEVQALTEYGEETAPASISFTILYPWYRSGAAFVVYVLLLILFIYGFMRYRIHRLKKEKLHLEELVSERTAEIAAQRDEIKSKSEYLEETLTELSNTQSELIRQEKMATVGKLTQGLIDRILNPLNYINNFSKLSIGLLGDISANIEDDKENMDEENYEDTVDVLEMLKGNLQKVADHGLNTTRTLKAMEELLKDRTGGVVKTDIKKILRKNEEVVSKYHEECIAKYGIKTVFGFPDTDMPFDGNPELLSKTFMSIINNGFYAVVKKAEKDKYVPEIRITASVSEGAYLIKFYDNGIGIEETILNKVFDPFFTTKPTGEASGVGLYLSREIIQNHHGEISVKSEKDRITEFTVEFKIEH